MASRKVLFIHHCGEFGGASRSLGELLISMPAGEVNPVIISQRGTAADYFGKLGFSVFVVGGICKFDITELGHYRGWRWLILLRELWYLPHTIHVLWSARRAHPDISLVHINDIQDFLLAFLIKRMFKVPIVIHIRGPLMQRRGYRFNFLMWTLRTKVDKVITIDETVKSSVHESVQPIVVHNGFVLKSQQHSAIGQIPMVVGMVSNLLVFKGVLDFVEAARLCKQRGTKIRFEVLGGKGHVDKGPLNLLLRWFGLQNKVESDVLDRIRKYELENSFYLLPFKEDVGLFYGSISVLCFPSHINAVGRPVFEAAFYKVPSIVAISEPKADAIVHMETGICIEANDPEKLADSIIYLCTNEQVRRSMGEKAFSLAHQNYDIARNASRLLDIYLSLWSISLPR